MQAEEDAVLRGSISARPPRAGKKRLLEGYRADSKKEVANW